MRLEFSSNWTRRFFYVKVIVMILWGVAIILSGSNRRSFSHLVMAFGGCWSLPFAGMLYWMIIRRKLRVVGEGPKAARAELATWWGPAILAVLALFVYAYVAYFQFEQRCGKIGSSTALAKCDYEGDDLSGKDLTGVNLTGADLKNTNLTGVILVNATLKEANLHGAVLVEADLTEANLSKADLTDTDLTGAQLDGANAANADFSRANFAGGDLTGANFAGVLMEDATGLTNEMLASLGDWHGLMFESRSRMINTLGRACQGEPVPEAAAYQGGRTDFHPLILLDSSGRQHSWTDKMPGSWWPSRSGMGELVACVEDEETITIQTCRYTPSGTVTRKQHQVSIRIVQARTGQPVATVTATGSTPGACPQTISSSQTKTGGRVGSGDVREALERYVNPTGRIAPLVVDSAP